MQYNDNFEFYVLVESLSISQYLEKYLKKKLVQFEVREGN